MAILEWQKLTHINWKKPTVVLALHIRIDDIHFFYAQVLARFEEFPGKKLEALRMAAALYSKLDAMVNTLTNWKIEAPLSQLLDKSESYVNKVNIWFLIRHQYANMSQINSLAFFTYQKKTAWFPLTNKSQ